MIDYSVLYIGQHPLAALRRNRMERGLHLRSKHRQPGSSLITFAAILMLCSSLSRRRRRQIFFLISGNSFRLKSRPADDWPRANYSLRSQWQRAVYRRRHALTPSVLSST
jgi:hypothetical protein